MAKFDLDSDETTFGDIVKFLKDEGIKSNLDKGSDDTMSDEAKKFAEEMAKKEQAKADGSSGEDQPKKDPNEETIDL